MWDLWFAHAETYKTPVRFLKDALVTASLSFKQLETTKLLAISTFARIFVPRAWSRSTFHPTFIHYYFSLGHAWQDRSGSHWCLGKVYSENPGGGRAPGKVENRRGEIMRERGEIKRFNEEKKKRSIYVYMYIYVLIGSKLVLLSRTSSSSRRMRREGKCASCAQPVRTVHLRKSQKAY